MYKQLKNKASYNPIVAPLSLAAQGVDRKYQENDRVFLPPLDFEKLNTLVLDRQFYESLEILAPYGFGEDTELYILRFIQRGGEA